jgi:hypothetical protein
MTHDEALERSRRAVDSRANCGHDLIELGRDKALEQCSLWYCPECGDYLSIDPHGIIRETGPIGVIAGGGRLEAQGGIGPTFSEGGSQ